MNTRTKHTQISQKTKDIVFARDYGCCVYCGKPVHKSLANAHIVPRSKGGLGIEQNIVTLCLQCHHDFDQTTKRAEYMKYMIKYISRFYEGWSEEAMKYKKGIQ